MGQIRYIDRPPVAHFFCRSSGKDSEIKFKVNFAAQKFSPDFEYIKKRIRIIFIKYFTLKLKD